MQAELRSKVILCVDNYMKEESNTSIAEPLHPAVNELPEDAMMAQLVREYLEFTNLEYSCSVFNAETENAGKASPMRYGATLPDGSTASTDPEGTLVHVFLLAMSGGRVGLSQQLGLGSKAANEKRPLLHTVKNRQETFERTANAP